MNGPRAHARGSEATLLSMAWLHDLSPFLFEFSKGVGLRWYGLSYALGFIAAWALLRLLASRGTSPIPRQRAMDAVMLTAICVVIGGRLGYVLIYSPSLLTDFGGSFPYWGVFKLHQGGMASHGGMVGALVAAFWLSKGFKDESGERIGAAPTSRILDVFCLVAPAGLLFGRLANFINGELLGKIAAPAGQPAPWWAVRFPQEVFERPDEISSEQWLGLARAVGMPDQAVTVAEQNQFETLYAGLVEQVQAGSAQAQQTLEPWINARHPSQLYQAIGEGLLVGAVVWVFARKEHKPLTISALFAIVYGAQRIVTEFWRLPDAHLSNALILGLSRGQWLSVIMVLAGVILLVWAMRRDSTRTPGWARKASSLSDD